MNVDSLRSNAQANAESAEVRIAKVAVTNVSLWAAIWSPYAFVVLLAVVGSRGSITPLLSQVPSFIAKTASCILCGIVWVRNRFMLVGPAIR